MGMTHPPRPRVLLAEGDPGLRQDLARELARDGSLVIEAGDGSALLDLLAATLRRERAAAPFDVIVTDERLPGVYGGPELSTMHVFAAMRAIDWHTPVIVLTAAHQKFLARWARQLGAVFVQPKPIDVETLRADVARALSAAVTTRASARWPSPPSWRRVSP